MGIELKNAATKISTSRTNHPLSCAPYAPRFFALCYFFQAWQARWKDSGNLSSEEEAMSVYRAPAWIDVVEFVGTGSHWHLTDAWDVPQKAAQVHVIAFLENGDPAYDAVANLFNDFGINIRLGLEHKQYDQAIADFTLGHGEFFNPDKGERGADQVRMLGFQSDIVTGIGLPMTTITPV